MEYIATCAFGLEKLVFTELKKLGLWIVKTEDGRVTFQGEHEDMMSANLWLRTSERVHLKVGEFEAHDFDQLFDNIYALDWGNIIPKDAQFPVLCTTSKSKLHNEPAIQSVSKKAIVKKLQSLGAADTIAETGSKYSILVRLNNDICTVSIDTTGESLHKRGYRTESGEAPIKETLAAAMVMLSDWTAERQLLDPFCGSGTILIEAAMIGLNMAPGLHRGFTFQSWPGFDPDSFTKIKKEAIAAQVKVPLKIYGSDIDPQAIALANKIVEKLDLGEYIKFDLGDFNAMNFSMVLDTTIISNPPYGERLGNALDTEKLYYNLGQAFRKAKKSSIYIITPMTNFEQLFNQKAVKNRKLFNGNIKCYYYQYPFQA